ncbi:serine hydrolase [Bradyrhizobium sp. 157]|uniref:serine hydrolase domain-containing protein n=1 Tax=Bradyrhizobium sp. 157 TaxID=2782631 RepID=UPI001FF9AACC|nr:serine hydrolase [Bradyrhizobium sp. 157]MCK1641329.1 serine hydrolase [Bradyrhizobium sp. 157]
MDVDRYMEAQRVSGFLVLKDGFVVLERYGLCRTVNDKWDSQSVTKSVTSILVGAAIQDGYIKSLDSLVTDYVHELKGSAYDGVTIRHLLTMTSGVKWNEDWNDPNSDACVELFSGGFVDGVDPTVAYMRGVSRADQAGAKFVYKTAETNLAGVLLSNAIDRSLSEYLSEKLWQPYGMENDAFWRVNSAGHEFGGLGICMSLRDYARIGQFMLEGGMAGDRQVLPPGWVADATNVRVTFEPESEEAESGLAGYGYSWWVLKNGYAALGHAGQAIFVYPQDRVVVAINSVWPEAQIEDNRKKRGAFVEALRAEAVAQQP